MAFRHIKGKLRTEWLPVTTSTVISKGSAVELTSGLIGLSDDNDTVIVGVSKKAIAATDADYATARSIPVLIPLERHVIWEADATAATFAAGDEGGEYGISSDLLVDRTDTSNKVFKVTRIISASKIQGYLLINGAY